ncbi:MAG: aromatic-ring-hydroxylating dioxygenase subunit beta [Candidatus Binataceae bacterium]|nr:aromatic-ring-hydroxylating dioxygenase subunit beta [Candidatus Binataceae bacterium]
MEATELRARIEDLQAAYAECLDSNRLEQWPEFFTERCIYKIIPYENEALGMPIPLMYGDSRGMLRDRVVAHRNANFFAPHMYRHLIARMRIAGNDHGVVSTFTNYAVYRTMLDPGDYGRSELFSVGVYQDKIVFENGNPLFQEKIVVIDTSQISTLLVTPL